MFTSNHSLLSLILFSLIASSLSRTFVNDATALHSSENRTNRRRHSEEVTINDSNRRLPGIENRQLLRNRPDAAVVMEGDPIITRNDANETSMVEVKSRNKRLVFVAPALPAIFQWFGLALLGSLVSSLVSQKPTLTFTLTISPGAGPDALMSFSKPSKGTKEPGKTNQPPPKTDEITGFPDLIPQKRKQGRKRWKDSETGKIYEWDQSHGGELEGYGKTKKHIGVFDHRTGEQIKPAKKGRRLEE